MEKAVPEQVKKDLHIWHNIITASQAGLSLPPRTNSLPLGSLWFISAAGGRSSKSLVEKTGGASLGVGAGGKVWWGSRVYWPIQLVWATAGQPVALSMLTVMLPLLLAPECCRHRHVVLETNNNALIWAWKKRHLKDEALTSVLIRALHILEAALTCKIYFTSISDNTVVAESIANRLTRASTSIPPEELLLTHPATRLPAPIRNWMRHPTADWSLGAALAEIFNK